MAQVGRKSTFEAGNVRFAVQHELWDGNLDDHSDQLAGEGGQRREGRLVALARRPGEPALRLSRLLGRWVGQDGLQVRLRTARSLRWRRVAAAEG